MSNWTQLGEIHLYKAGRSLFTGSVLLFLCGNRQGLQSFLLFQPFLIFTLAFLTVEKLNHGGIKATRKGLDCFIRVAGFVRLLLFVQMVCTLDYLSEGYIQWTITIPGTVITSFEANLHFNKLGTPFGTFDYAISTRSTSGTEDVKYGLSKGKWEVEFTGIATAANGDMYSVVDGAKLTFSVTK